MIQLHDLPKLNACLNALSAVWLISGLVFIRRGRVSEHRFCMLAAVVTSMLFLTSYIVYHAQVGTTRFQTQGWVRHLYLLILGTHTILAVLVVPLVLITLRRALGRRFDRHRRMARITWPIWVYVSVTGVVIYWMLYHIDPALRAG
jgi:putative membrane protein